MFKKKLNDFGNFPFIFVFIAIILFFLITGSSFFPEWDSSFNSIITTYLIMMVVFMYWARKDTRTFLKMPLKNGLIGFTIGLFVTVLLMNVLISLKVMSSPSLPQEIFWSTVILHMFVVAPVEEVIFRGIWLEYTGVLISSILFAAWHMYSYGFIWYEGGWSSFNWSAMIIAFIIGMILALIVQRSKDITDKRIKLGIPCAVGIHAAYNLCILGAFYFGV